MRWRTSPAARGPHTGSRAARPRRGGVRVRLAFGLIAAALLLVGSGSARADTFVAATPEAPAGYGAFLEQYVVKTDLPESGFETRFDYGKLYGKNDQIAIRHLFRRHFQEQRPSELKPAMRTAWAINAYNFFVIDAVLTYMTSHEGEIPASVKDLGGEESIFDEEILLIEDETYSLNSFERHFLFLDRDPGSGKVPAKLDPRIHFALVCGAIGCPPLWPEPFRGRKLDRQLDDCTANALAGPRCLRVEGKKIHACQLFAWYKGDFANHGGVVGFLKEFVPEERKKSLFGGELMKPVVTDIEWDWALNRP